MQPGAKISYRVTVDPRGGWAYHCHLLGDTRDLTEDSGEESSDTQLVAGLRFWF